MIDHGNMTYQGPVIDDPEILDTLPRDLTELLNRINGFILYDGGFHVRGACSLPEWHSLRHAWHTGGALHRRYRKLTESDIPFAEESTGDQFLLRSGSVYRLWCETGELQDLHQDLTTFFDSVHRHPLRTLSMEPFLEFRRQGGELQPGELLSVMPPFCMAESGEGVSYRAISAHDRLGFLADLASQLEGIPDGTVVRFEIVQGKKHDPAHEQGE